MRVTRDPADWPGDDPSAIALAARVVMLSAASRTCTIGYCTDEQRVLLADIHRVTELKHVAGDSFPDFLAGAKQRLAAHMRLERPGPGLDQTLADVARCEPVDLIGELYDRLVELASRVYEEDLGEPRLSRSVIETGAWREFPVGGAAFRDTNEVELVIYPSGFDLAALALVPYILAHELVCHIAARHTGVWVQTPEPDVRSYFSDGFMDRVAWLLLGRWMADGTLPRVTPVGQLTMQELQYNAKRPPAFGAGRAAFENCSAKTTERLTVEQRFDGDTHGAHVFAASWDASIRTALKLNTDGSHIIKKDWFVHYAMGEQKQKASTFAEVALGRGGLSKLLDDEPDHDRV
jgi:hypothetical protein